MRTSTKLGIAAGAGAVSYFALRSVAQFADVRRYSGVASGKRIVILGAGFAGMSLACELARLLPEEDNGEIVLIDEDNYLLFTPMLTEAAGGQIDPQHIAISVHRLPKRVHFIQGVIQSIEPSTRTVKLLASEGAIEPKEIEIKADELIVALGSVTNYHHVEGAREHTLGVKRLGDASEICARVLANIERATVEDDASKRKQLLTFVVIGGGYTGVETVAAVNDLLRSKVVHYGLDPDEVRVVLIETAGRILAETSAELASYAQSKLERNGVEVRLKTSVSSVTPRGVEIRGGEEIRAGVVVWAAGVKPNPVVEALPWEKGKHGGLKTDRYCRVLNAAGVWALGDCAEIPDPKGGTYAPIAQNATREGELTARNIAAGLLGEPLKPFRYKPVGELALIGKHDGVARIFNVNIRGSLAWALWRAVYLAKIPGAGYKARIAAEWLMDVMFRRDTVPMSSTQTTQEKKTAAVSSSTA